MKKHLSASVKFAISACLTLLFIYSASSQANFNGTWEGVFMNDFRTVITFSVNQGSPNPGNIRMYAGENRIQDDDLQDIQLSTSLLTFTIPAKETTFAGNFNDSQTELSGEFTFPDGSKHPIHLKRKITQEKTLEEFRSVKQNKLDSKELQSDLLFLYTSLKENHPRPYAFTSKDSLDLLFEQLKGEVDGGLTLEQFYWRTKKLTYAINCSHTDVKLPSSYREMANEFGNYFPLRLFFDDGKAFYVSGLSEDENQLLPGDEILAINGEPIDRIRENLFYLIPAEGCNETTRYNELNKSFNSLFYLLDDSETFEIRFRTGASLKDLKVSSVKLADVKWGHNVTDNGKTVEYSLADENALGILKVSSFAMPNMDRYLFQLDSIFNDLKGKDVRDLVLDLRDNRGGHPIFAAQLLSYLTDQEFVYFKRNEDVKEFEPLYNAMQPNETNFNGNTYVFINGGCLSTTGHLISLLKFYTDAKFVGEEPGSSYTCNDFSMQLGLPHTGILLNVPRTEFETAVSGFARCEPFPIDQGVKVKAKNLVNNTDPYLEWSKSIENEQ